MLIPAVLLVAISVLYGLGTETVYSFISPAIDTLTNPDIYINAVLKE
jgi:multicomponent Na+:H+ antiporter subunit D